MKTIGNVTFRWRRRFRPAPGAELSDKSKPCKWPLTWARATGQKLKLSSQNVTVEWTLTARSADGSDNLDMAGYQVGVTNTVLLSERSWYYHSRDRAKLVDHVVGVPVWDGMNEDPRPWYSGPEDFEELDEDDIPDFPPGSRAGDASARIAFNDAPYTGPFDANDRMGALRLAGAPLFLVNGFDTFCAWLAVADPAGTVHVLDSFPWYVRYGLRVHGGKVDQDNAFRFLPTSGTYLLGQGPRFSRNAKLNGACSEGMLRCTEGRYTRSEIENIIGYVAEV